MSTAAATSTCAQCGQSFPDSELNLTANGKVCNLCEADTMGDELSASSFNMVRNAAIGALVCNIIATVFSMRTTSKVGFSSGGHGSSTTSVGPDMIGLVGAGLALLFVLGGIVLALKARGIDQTEAEKKKMLYRKLIYIVALLILGAWGAVEFLDALPHTTTTSY